jgi:ATP-dependent RNA helicase RhlE
MTFNELKLIDPVQQALNKKGYVEPTPIQEKTIPYILQGRDIFGCAQTGTGKTAAFSLPILQNVHLAKQKQKTPGIKALILAPTRELALQISDSIKTYGCNLPVRQAVIFGGVSQFAQVNELRRGIDILIATPGRLLDLMNQGYIKLNAIEFFVLDEADRMLDMGFINDIRKIIAKLPAKKQTLFFSATVPAEVKILSDSLLHDPVTVSTTPVSSPNDSVKQSVFYVEKGDKRALLKYVIENEEIDHALVFTRTKHGADKVVKDLVKSGITAEAIHGNKSQNARQRALVGFKNRSIRVLVATDIASRGIDIDKLSHVINYELPNEPETYVHRIGRTGRAGEVGTAFSFCDAEEVAYLRDITKLLKKTIDVNIEHPYTATHQDDGRSRPKQPQQQRQRSPRQHNQGQSSRPNNNSQGSNNSRRAKTSRW